MQQDLSSAKKNLKPKGNEDMDEDSDSDFEVNECSENDRIAEDNQFDDQLVDDEDSINS